MNLGFILQAILAICFVFTAVNMSNNILKNHKGELSAAPTSKWIKCLGIGALCNFMDTLGIGSFAPTTFMYKLTKAGVDDLNLPGTLNVGDTFPVIFEAIIFISSVECDPVFLVSMCVAAMIGSYGGAEIVTKWDRNPIRYAMSLFLAITAVVMIMKAFSLGPFAMSGTEIGLTGGKWIAALIANVVFGALMDIGFGLYAPCMAFCVLLGVDISACFPVFMGSCALLMPANSLVFVKKSRYDVVATVGNMIGGCFGVLFAWKVVTSMPVQALTIVIAIVMIWTCYMMLRDAAKENAAKKAKA